MNSADGSMSHRREVGVRPVVEPEIGFEPMTCCLQDSCSGQLSYSGRVSVLGATEISGEV